MYREYCEEFAVIRTLEHIQFLNCFMFPVVPDPLESPRFASFPTFVYLSWLTNDREISIYYQIDKELDF